MTDLAYLPLKTPDGQLAGHARLAPDGLTVRLRRPLGGQAVALTDSGCFFGAPESALRISGTLRAVGVETHGHLLCFGVAPDGAGAEAELRRRLMTAQAPSPAAAAGSAPSRPVSVPADSAPESAPAPANMPPAPAASEAAPVFAPAPLQSAPAPTQSASVPEATRESQPVRTSLRQSARAESPAAAASEAAPERTTPEPSARPRFDDSAPAPASRQAAQDALEPPAFSAPEAVQAEPPRAPEPAPAPAFHPSSPPVQAPFTEPEPAPATATFWPLSEPESVEASAADSSAFMALLRRADAVFQSLETPVPPPEAGSFRRGASLSPSAPAHAGAERSSRAAAAQPSCRCGGWTAPGDGAEPPAAFGETPPHPPQREGGAPAARRRNAWSEQVDAILEMPAAVERERFDNPFPHIFPNAVFTRVRGGNVMEHLEGDWLDGGTRRRILAVRGDYAPQPPKHLFGFTRYIRTRSGGFWVKVL